MVYLYTVYLGLNNQSKTPYTRIVKDIALLANFSSDISLDLLPISSVFIYVYANIYKKKRTHNGKRSECCDPSIYRPMPCFKFTNYCRPAILYSNQNI